MQEEPADVHTVLVSLFFDSFDSPNCLKIFSSRKKTYLENGWQEAVLEKTVHDPQNLSQICAGE